MLGFYIIRHFDDELGLYFDLADFSCTTADSICRLLISTRHYLMNPRADPRIVPTVEHLIGVGL